MHVNVWLGKMWRICIFSLSQGKCENAVPKRTAGAIPFLYVSLRANQPHKLFVCVISFSQRSQALEC